MGRRTELVTHIINGTDSLCLMEEHGKLDAMVESLGKILKQYNRIFSVHVERGKDVEIKCWEDVWTSGMSMGRNHP